MKHLLFQFATVFFAYFIIIIVYLAIAIVFALFDILNSQTAIALGFVAFAHYIAVSYKYLFDSSN